MARFAYKNSLGAGWSLSFLDNEGSSSTPGFLGVLYHANTAERTYTFPDKDGTLATTADALVNPMTTLGDIIVAGAAGVPTRLAKGTDGQLLAMVSGGLAWTATLPTLTIDPGGTNANGDMLFSGRLGGSTNSAHLGVNWNGGFYVVPNPNDLSFNLQHPTATPTIGHTLDYDAEIYDSTGRVAFSRIRTVTTNVSGAGSSTGDMAFFTLRAGVLTEGMRLKGSGNLEAYASIIGAAGTTAHPTLRIPDGEAPSVPGLGDVWAASGHLYYHDGATAKDLVHPMTTLGDIITGGASGAPSRLAGNTSTTPQFLKSLGSAGLATAPVWAQIAAADLSDGVTGTGSLVKAQGPTFSGAKVLFPASASGYASINLASGATVSSPASGDLWNQSGVLYFRTGGGISVPLSDALINPISGTGDLIYGSGPGTAARLAGNSTTTVQYLRSLGTGAAAQAPSWVQPSVADLSEGSSGSGAVVRVQGPTFSGAKVLFPATAAGYASLGLPPGTAPSSPVAGDLWNVSGLLYFQDASTSQQLAFNPMTTPGDLVVGGTAGAPARLAKGTDTHVLTMVAGAVAWAAPAGGLTNPMTTLGDLIVGGTAGAPERLAKGTDGQILKMVSGNIAWQDNTAGQAQEDVLGVVVDGGGVAITTGSKGYREVPYNCTITGWTILGKESGSCVVDVRRATYANFPTTSSIAGSEKPTLSSAQKNQDTTLSTWTTSLTAGDILEFNVESATTVTRIMLSLKIQRT